MSSSPLCSASPSNIGSCEILVMSSPVWFSGAAATDSTSVRVSDILSIVVELMIVFLPDDGFDDDYTGNNKRFVYSVYGIVRLGRNQTQMNSMNFLPLRIAYPNCRHRLDPYPLRTICAPWLWALSDAVYFAVRTVYLCRSCWSLRRISPNVYGMLHVPPNHHSLNRPRCHGGLRLMEIDKNNYGKRTSKWVAVL